jgi:hypothetical protein
MRATRVYFIGRDGHFLRAIDIQVGSDQDAIARALELREGHEVGVGAHEVRAQTL